MMSVGKIFFEWIFYRVELLLVLPTAIYWHYHSHFFNHIIWLINK